MVHVIKLNIVTLLSWPHPSPSLGPSPITYSIKNNIHLRWSNILTRTNSLTHKASPNLHYIFFFFSDVPSFPFYYNTNRSLLFLLSAHITRTENSPEYSLSPPSFFLRRSTFLSIRVSPSPKSPVIVTCRIW